MYVQYMYEEYTHLFYKTHNLTHSSRMKQFRLVFHNCHQYLNMLRISLQYEKKEKNYKFFGCFEIFWLPLIIQWMLSLLCELLKNFVGQNEELILKF